MEQEPTFRFRHDNIEAVELFLRSMNDEQLMGVIESCHRQISKVQTEMELAEELLRLRHES